MTLNALAKECILMAQSPQRLRGADAVRLRGMLDELDLRLRQGSWEELTDDTITAAADGTRKLMVLAFVNTIRPALDDTEG